MSYRGTSPEDCKVILAAIIESYKDFLDDTYLNFSEETLKLITKASDVLKKGERVALYLDLHRKLPPCAWNENRPGHGRRGAGCLLQHCAEDERQNVAVVGSVDAGDDG